MPTIVRTVTRIDPRTGQPREYKHRTVTTKCRAFDANDKTIGECINNMESGVKINATINASPNNFRGLFG